MRRGSTSWRRWGERAKPEPGKGSLQRRDAETQRQAQRRPRQLKTRERGGSGGTRAGGGARVGGGTPGSPHDGAGLGWGPGPGGGPGAGGGGGRGATGGIPGNAP